MKKRWMTLLLILTAGAACLASAMVKESLSGKLVITGSSTVAPLVSEIAKRFEAQHPHVRVDVQTGGSSRGIADVRQRLAQIGMASRELKDHERDLYGTAIARDGISIIVHNNNAVTHLTNADVRNIYMGRITNWKSVGGHDAPITVVNKASGRATLELFLRYFKLNNTGIKAHVVIGDNEQGIKMVANNPNAIAYVSIGTAEYDVTHGIPIKLLPIGNIAATQHNVKKGMFPLSRPLTLVTNRVPTGLIKAFIDFARSQEIHSIVWQQYFVPITE